MHNTWDRKHFCDQFVRDPSTWERCRSHQCPFHTRRNRTCDRQWAAWAQEAKHQHLRIIQAPLHLSGWGQQVLVATAFERKTSLPVKWTLRRCGSGSGLGKMVREHLNGPCAGLASNIGPTSSVSLNNLDKFFNLLSPLGKTYHNIYSEL